MSSWSGATATSDVGWSHLERLVDIGSRMAGSDGERAAAEATRSAFDEIGARDVHLEPFEVPRWERGEASIEADGSTQPCIALPLSPAGSVSGELVDVGYGLPDDFDEDLEGAIVMASTNVPDWFDRFIHRQEKYARAIDAGAAGFIFANHLDGCLAPTGSVPGPDGHVGEIPAVGVSNEVGRRLARRWEDRELSLDVEAATTDGTSHNVHADLGPETEEVLLLTSHVDAHDIAEGAADNAAGTATVLEVANALKRREDELETRVHLIVFGAEEVGLLGSTYDADHRDLDTVKAVVNNDGVARERTLEFHHFDTEEIEGILASVAERLSHPYETVPTPSRASDHWPYMQWGIPGAHVMSVTEGRDRGWGHTAGDTIDKLDVRNLREQAIFLTETVVDLGKGTVRIEHRDPEEIATALEAADLAEAMRLIGEWPY